MTNIKRLTMTITAAMLGIAVTGCASTSVSKTVHAAPIVYKVGDGATQYASLATPRTPSFSTVPDSYIPAQPYIQTQPTPAPQTTQRFDQFQQSFDQASVDSDLYKHQRVGNTYSIMGKSYTPKHQPDYDVTGVASWYGDKFHGKPTATGETYDMHDLTAAHKTLPLNSMLFVTNIENGKSLMVRLNDRGPFVGDRIIDLSKASADALGISGLGQVRVQYAGPADPMAANRAPVRPPVEIARPIEEVAEAPVAAPRPTVPYSPPATTPQYSQPQYSEPQYTAPQYTPPQPAPYVPAAPVNPTSPQALGQQDQTPDGQVTLTIKGPIHVASHTGPRPELIRERHYVK